MAKFDPPWRLDPLQNIVNVGWGAGSYALISYSVEYNFGTPSGIKAVGIPGYGEYGYNFTPFEFEVLRDGVNEKPPINPITPKLVSSVQSAGRGNVTIFNSPDGASTSAGADVLVPLRDADWEVTVTVPGNLGSKPGDPITLYDGYFEITVFYSDGSHGSGNGGFTGVTLEQLQQIQADVNGSSPVATWTGTVTVTNTYDVPGSSTKHVVHQFIGVAGKKFKGKDAQGNPKTEDIPVQGSPNPFRASGISEDNPIGDKTLTVKWSAKSKVLSIS